MAADRLSVRWYPGYDLHELLPDHSDLTRTRERSGLRVFRRFFERIVEACVEVGLVRGERLLFDSTKVGTNVEGDALPAPAPRRVPEARTFLIRAATTTTGVGDADGLALDLVPQDATPWSKPFFETTCKVKRTALFSEA